MSQNKLKISLYTGRSLVVFSNFLKFMFSTILVYYLYVTRLPPWYHSNHSKKGCFSPVFLGQDEAPDLLGAPSDTKTTRQFLPR